MFQPSGFGLKIFQQRYAIHENETWDEACKRLASYVAMADVGEKHTSVEAEFYNALNENLFMPGGRIWYGAGRAKGQMLNCISGNTLVHTKEGLVPARSLKGTVSTLSKDGVYRDAIWSCYGEQPLYRIVLNNGDEFFATAEHEWLTTNDGGRRRGEDGFNRTKTVDLVNKHIPLQPLAQFIYDEDEWKIGVQHGLVFGDGNLYAHGKYSMLRQFSDSKELIPMFFEKWSTYEKIDALNVSKLPKEFKKLPLGKSNSYIRGFIAGFIAADGCVAHTGHVMAHQANLEILTQIRQLASMVGIPSTSIKLVRELNPWDGSLAPLWKLTFVKSAFYQNGQVDEHLILKTKHRNYAKQAPKPKKRTTIKVIIVEPTDRIEDVYCCVEPITHTMVIGPGYLTGQCFVVPTEDSREGWGKTVSDMIVVSGTGGGVGMNMSPIRPRGSKINGAGGIATGSISLMEIINSAGEVIKAGGGRRTALMLCLNLTHGDIIEFLDKKLDLKQLNNANVSVNFDSDPEVFFAKVRANEELALNFNGREVGRINAKVLFDKILTNALKGGEPGLLNGYYANKMSNIWYWKPLISTNPCQPGWAKVLTPQGIRTFNDISEGSIIWSGKRWTKVIKKWSTGIKPVFGYHTTAGSFYGTDKHKIVSAGEKIEVGVAQSIDYAQGPVSVKEPLNPQYIMDGLVIGDGSMHKASNDLVYLNIGKDDNDYFNSELKEYIVEPRYGISPYAWAIITSIGHLEHTYNRVVPQEFYNGNSAKIRAFLRGLYSANGSVVGNRVTLKATSLELIRQVRDMLSALGIASYFTTNKPKLVKFSNGQYECKESYDLNITKDRVLFANLIGFIQSEKTVRLEESCTTVSTKAKITYEIVSIEEFGEEEVFDITVEDPQHTYWTGGLLVSNCGEIWLPEYGCCDLGALVLPRFISDRGFEWGLLKKTIHTAVRFLDNVLTVNNYPLAEIATTAKGERRIGLGVMGLHDVLLLQGFKYSSAQGLEFVDKLMKFIKNAAYEGSIELAKEKGSFAVFERDKFLKSNFIKTLKPTIRDAIKKYGIRNCALLTIPPTGTTAMVCGVTSGIECMYAPAYERRWWVGDKREMEVVIHPLFEQYVKNGQDVSHFEGTYDLDLRDHFEMQKICQKHIDNAVSKTINVRPGTSKEALADMYMEYFPELKGVTIYPEGSREDQPLTPISLEKAISHVGNTMVVESFAKDTCKDGTCEI